MNVLLNGKRSHIKDHWLHIVYLALYFDTSKNVMLNRGYQTNVSMMILAYSKGIEWRVSSICRKAAEALDLSVMIRRVG